MKRENPAAEKLALVEEFYSHIALLRAHRPRMDLAATIRADWSVAQLEARIIELETWLSTNPAKNGKKQ
jgi:hypothetical protein